MAPAPSCSSAACAQQRCLKQHFVAHSQAWDDWGTKEEGTGAVEGSGSKWAAAQGHYRATALLHATLCVLRTAKGKHEKGSAFRGMDKGALGEVGSGRAVA
jgi:hypothetical protein